MMRGTRVLLMFLILLVIISGYPVLWAKDETSAQDRAIEEKKLDEARARIEARVMNEDISGLVIDNTVTFIGRDFYHYFSRYWSNQGLMENYNLTVREQPTARYGSRVGVEWNRRIVFQVFLPPTRANIEASAKAAAQSIAQRFKAMEVQRLLFIDPDLAPDEF